MLRLKTWLFRTAALYPSTLFQAGEVGAWYDPSDLSTLYQDAAGTTPVTTPGQVVGLVLDKSRGAVRNQLLVNGEFASNASGWTAQNATASVSAGQVTITNTGPNGGIYQAIPTVVGRTYFASIQLTSAPFGGGNVLFFIKSDSTDWATPNRVNLVNSQSAVQTYLSSFTATATTTYIHIINGSSTVNHSVTVDNASIVDVPGNHATQSGATSARPIYRVDAGGRPYLEFDGIDDWLQTSTITPGTDKAQVFAGVRKFDTPFYAAILETSAVVNTNNGSLALFVPPAPITAYDAFSRGSPTLQFASVSSPASPDTAVIAAIYDIAAPSIIVRRNGVAGNTNTASQGTGNYLAYPLYIGRRGGTALPFSGNLYGLIVRFGANLSAAQISNAERWMGRKTGVTI